MEDTQWWMGGWGQFSVHKELIPQVGCFSLFHLLPTTSHVTPCLHNESANPLLLPGACALASCCLSQTDRVWVNHFLALGSGSLSLPGTHHFLPETFSCVTFSSSVVLDVFLSCGFLLRAKLSSFHPSVILPDFGFLQPLHFLFFSNRDHT